MSIKIEILTASYWEHFKAAKDLAMLHPVEHPKRIAVENALNEIQSEINALK